MEIGRLQIADEQTYESIVSLCEPGPRLHGPPSAANLLEWPHGRVPSLAAAKFASALQGYDVLLVGARTI